MIEFRAVKSEELDQMLALMCDAFGLPFTAARDIFYKDPYFDIDKKRVLIEDGNIISCLTIVHSPLRIGSAIVNVGGVAGVATRKSHRRMGYGGKLLLASLPVMRDQGYGLAALFPYAYAYYRKFGWERASTQYRVIFNPTILPHFTNVQHMRTANSSDRPEMRRLYDAQSSDRTGYRFRDEKRWKYLAEYVKTQLVYKHGSVQGYVLHDSSELPNGQRRIRILEVCAATEEARRGICGYFAEAADVAEIEYTGGWRELHESGLLAHPDSEDDRTKPFVEATPGAMLRVVDFARCLNDISPNLVGFTGRVALSMRDEHAPPGAQCEATLMGDGAAVAVEARLCARDTIEGDVQAWTAVVSGYLSLRDAVALNRLHPSSENAVRALEDFFPRREPFIPAADHF